MLVQSEGIVLKVTKYGESSLICQVFTRTYGLKSFMIKGGRSVKKSGLKANVFQPGNIVNFEFYNSPNKTLFIIKEAAIQFPYFSLREDIARNCVQLFMLEVLIQVLEQEFPQEDLYDFVRAIFEHLDRSEVYIALLPSFFLIYINKLSGYTIYNNSSTKCSFFNIWEGTFQEQMPQLPPFLDETASAVIAQLNTISDVLSLSEVNHHFKQHDILNGLLVYMEHHYPNFKPLKSLPVLSTILA